MSQNRRIYTAFLSICMLLTAVGSVYAQDNVQDPAKRYKVSGGVLTELAPDTTHTLVIDEAKQLFNAHRDSLQRMAADTTLSTQDRRAAQRAEKELLKAMRDTMPRYSAIFRDTIPISRMCAISIIAPGFSQLYNKQAWKIPILYGTVGAATYFAIQQNKKYGTYRSTYDEMIRRGATREEIDPVQRQMIKYNTGRTLLLTGAIASYIYFIGDGAVNYNGPVNRVKKATTLSTIFPGAGQFYNKSYWKVPIVLGAFATMGYVIDFNSRGYKRFKLAYDLVTDGDDSTVDEFKGRYSADFLKNLRNNYRRNRDLSIILTAGVYLLNIIDAHVDAHLKDFDVSDDLAMTFEPTLVNFYTLNKGNVNGIGMALKFKF